MKNQKRKFAYKALDMAKRYPLPLNANQKGPSGLRALEIMISIHRDTHPGLYEKYPRKKKKVLKRLFQTRTIYSEDDILRFHYDQVKAIHNRGGGRMPTPTGNRHQFIPGVATVAVIKCGDVNAD